MLTRSKTEPWTHCWRVKAAQQEREVLSAVCIYPHVGRMTGPHALTDYVIQPFWWHAHSASGLHSLSTSVSFCFVLCFWQTTARSTLLSYHQPGQSQEMRVRPVLICRSRAVSRRSAVCLCVSLLETHLSVKLSGAADVPQPKPTAAVIHPDGERCDPEHGSALWFDGS